MAEHDQQFANKVEFLRNREWLTRRGSHVVPICFDAFGRPVLTCNDFTRAEDEDALPVRWLWPNQVAQLGVASNFAAVVAADNPALDTRWRN